MTAPGRPPGRRVLIVSGLQVHPTLSGGMLRTHALATALRRRGCDVFVYSLTGRKRDFLARRRSSTDAWPDGVREHVERGPLAFVRWIASYVAGLPPLWLTARLGLAARTTDALLPGGLRERLGWCDAVVADFPFLHPVLAARGARGRLRIVNTHNVEHRLFDAETRWGRRWIRSAVRAVELRAAAGCDVLVSCSPDDDAYLTANAPVRRSLVVPNGVDVRRFEGLGGLRDEARRTLGIADGTRVVLFTASRWGPNAEAFAFLDAFARDRPDVLERNRLHLLVVGSVTSEPVRRPGLTATGVVPETEPYFAAADAALNPIASGTGTNLKTCEYLAARLPLVTTTFGARGFHVTDGATGIVFERDALAAALDRLGALLDAPARAREMADAALAANRDVVDMDACVRVLADAIDAAPGADAASGAPAAS